MLAGWCNRNAFSFQCMLGVHCLYSLRLLFFTTLVLHRHRAVAGMQVGRKNPQHVAGNHIPLSIVCVPISTRSLLYVSCIHIYIYNPIGIHCIHCANVPAIAGVSALQIMYGMQCKRLALVGLGPAMFRSASRRFHPLDQRANADEREHIQIL